MSKSSDIMDKIATQEVYLYNDTEEMVFRTTPGKDIKYYCRFSGTGEFEIRHKTDQLLVDILSSEEITKEQYEDY